MADERRPQLPDLWSINAVAASLGISRGQLYKLIREGAIAAVRVGDRIKISGDAVTEYIVQNTLRVGGSKAAEG
jgi:excisionase family DNA binding protein